LEDIDVARDRALQQATDTINGTRQHIADTQSLQIKLRKEADSYKNNKMPANLKQQIDDADRDLSNNQQLIVSQRKELDSIRERYAAEKKRYIEITNGTATC
jgi:DNA gyrase/topoisomerase IV subunit A